MNDSLKKVLVIFVVGILIGIALIIVSKQSNSSVSTQETEKVALRNESEIQAEIDDVNSRLIPLTAQMEQELVANGKTELYTLYEEEVNKLQTQMNELVKELDAVKNPKSSENKVSDGKSPLGIVGVIVIIVTVIASAVIYILDTKKNSTTISQ